MGAMLGAVAGFKQQNAASGLPLRLLPEELALALDRGWARGYRLRGEGAGVRGARSATGAADPFLGGGDAEGGRGGGGGGNGAAAATGGGGKGREQEEERNEAGGGPSPSWRGALAQGTHLTLTAAAPEHLRVYFDGGGGEDASPLFSRPRPHSRAAASHSVFRDLHGRGYCLTPGANFGAHWLAYPSDPMLYHAQLCVRVCCSYSGGGEEEGSGEEDEERETTTKGSSSKLAASMAPLCPTLLAAASRGAHAARKHLLLAYPDGGGWREERVHYLTIAPEAGFGS